jgi:hypothetical protein
MCMLCWAGHAVVRGALLASAISPARQQQLLMCPCMPDTSYLFPPSMPGVQATRSTWWR